MGSGSSDRFRKVFTRFYDIFRVQSNVEGFQGSLLRIEDLGLRV